MFGLENIEKMAPSL